MQFFSSRKKIKPIWSFNANGLIWKLLASSDGYIVGEDRQKDAKTVTFFCIDLALGNVLWKDKKFDESWWVGLEAVHKNVVFIHEYATPDMPGHKKIYALDVPTGNPLWENEDNQYIFSVGENVYTVREKFESRAFTELHFRTGSVVRELDAQTVNALRDASPQPEEPFNFPVMLDPGKPESFQIVKILESNSYLMADIPYIETMERNETVIIGLYKNISPTPDEVSMEQHLMIMDRADERMVFHELLNQGAKMPVPDAFFGKDNFVYFIREKHILTAITLPTSAG